MSVAWVLLTAIGSAAVGVLVAVFVIAPSALRKIRLENETHRAQLEAGVRRCLAATGSATVPLQGPRHLRLVSSMGRMLGVAALVAAGRRAVGAVREHPAHVAAAGFVAALAAGFLAVLPPDSTRAPPRAASPPGAMVSPPRVTSPTDPPQDDLPVVTSNRRTSARPDRPIPRETKVEGTTLEEEPSPPTAEDEVQVETDTQPRPDPRPVQDPQLDDETDVPAEECTVEVQKLACADVDEDLPHPVAIVGSALLASRT